MFTSPRLPPNDKMIVFVLVYEILKQVQPVYRFVLKPLARFQKREESQNERVLMANPKDVVFVADRGSVSLGRMTVGRMTAPVFEPTLFHERSRVFERLAPILGVDAVKRGRKQLTYFTSTTTEANMDGNGEEDNTDR